MSKDIPAGLICAGVMLGLAFTARWAHARGYISEDMTLRVVALNGLLIAWLGNAIPKKMAPNACAQRAMRVSGWSMVLSGLTYTVLWAFAPIPVAVTIGTGAVFAGVVFTIGYCFWLHGQARRPA